MRTSWIPARFIFSAYAVLLVCENAGAQCGRCAEQLFPPGDYCHLTWCLKTVFRARLRTVRVARLYLRDEDVSSPVVLCRTSECRYFTLRCLHTPLRRLAVLCEFPGFVLGQWPFGAPERLGPRTWFDI